jgi:hypothetical protein
MKTTRIITMCVAAGIAVAAGLPAQVKSPQKTGQLPARQQAASQQQFDSPEAAESALISTLQSEQAAALASLLGPGARTIMTSGDASQDRAEQAQFVRLYQAKHTLKTDPRDPNRVILLIGDEDWPFPVPLVRRNGKWAFDSSETEVEMKARRIGANELDAIEICAGYVDAQKQYASEEHGKAGTLTYASRIMSTSGAFDGLYGSNEGDMLVPRGFAEAEWNGAGAKPYHGYYFRILYGQGPNAPGGAHEYRVKDKLLGGFGLVAWPARYGETGVSTFIVNQEGVVYRKDIAPAPNSKSSPVTRFDPDPTWSPVE